MVVKHDEGSNKTITLQSENINNLNSCKYALPPFRMKCLVNNWNRNASHTWLCTHFSLLFLVCTLDFTIRNENRKMERWILHPRVFIYFRSLSFSVCPAVKFFAYINSICNLCVRLVLAFHCVFFFFFFFIVVAEICTWIKVTRRHFTVHRIVQHVITLL